MSPADHLAAAERLLVQADDGVDDGHGGAALALQALAHVHLAQATAARRRDGNSSPLGTEWWEA